MSQPARNRLVVSLNTPSLSGLAFSFRFLVVRVVWVGWLPGSVMVIFCLCGRVLAVTFQFPFWCFHVMWAVPIRRLIIWGDMVMVAVCPWMRAVRCSCWWSFCSFRSSNPFVRRVVLVMCFGIVLWWFVSRHRTMGGVVS